MVLVFVLVLLVLIFLVVRGVGKIHPLSFDLEWTFWFGLEFDKNIWSIGCGDLSPPALGSDFGYKGLISRILSRY